MMKSLKANAEFKILLLVLAIATIFLLPQLAQAENRSRGKYWSFTDGSKGQYSRSADPVGASIVDLDIFEASTISDEESFDLYIQTSGGPTREISIFSILPENVKELSGKSVYLEMTKDDGLYVSSDSGMLDTDSDLTYSIQITMKDQGGGFKNDSACSARYDTQRRHYEESYWIGIDFLNKESHRLGSFEGKLYFRSAVRTLDCGGQFDIPDMGLESGRGLYNWLRGFLPKKLEINAKSDDDWLKTWNKMNKDVPDQSKMKSSRWK